MDNKLVGSKVYEIGLNISSNPKIYNKYQTTNIFMETKKKPSIKRIINQIVDSYEKFFININSYNYKSYKRQADLMVLN